MKARATISIDGARPKVIRFATLDELQARLQGVATFDMTTAIVHIVIGETEVRCTFERMPKKRRKR